MIKNLEPGASSAEKIVAGLNFDKLMASRLAQYEPKLTQNGSENAKKIAKIASAVYSAANCIPPYDKPNQRFTAEQAGDESFFITVDGNKENKFNLTFEEDAPFLLSEISVKNGHTIAKDEETGNTHVLERYGEEVSLKMLTLIEELDPADQGIVNFLAKAVDLTPPRK